MIFCTVGTQLPFDRLVEYLVRWSSDNSGISVVYQVGGSERFIESDGFHALIKEPFFSATFDSSDVVVSHAGMGNIIRALDSGKPIVVVPRVSAYGEHINDHQLDTADSFSGLPNVFLANDYDEFVLAMSRACDFKAEFVVSDTGLRKLISAVAEFVGS